MSIWKSTLHLAGIIEILNDGVPTSAENHGADGLNARIEDEYELFGAHAEGTVGGECHAHREDEGSLALFTES